MKRKLIPVFSILLFSFPFSEIAGAQWVQVGLAGVHVSSLVESGSDPSNTVLFAGSSAGTVFRSDLSGTKWEEVIGISSAIYCVAGVNATVYAGGTDGIILSTNGGDSWSAAGGGVIGYYSDVLTLAANGPTLFAGSGEYGVFLSTDYGQSWSARSNGLANMSVLSVAMGGSDASPYVFAGTKSGIFRSDDSGLNWTTIDSGLTNTYINSIMAYNTGAPQALLFAGTAGGGIFRSTDNGSSWAAENEGLSDSLSVYDFASDGSNLFAGAITVSAKGKPGVLLSNDNGETWSDVSAGLKDSNVVALVVDGQYIYAGTQSDGVWRRALTDFGIGAGVSQPSATESNLSAYPNPFSKSTTIDFITPESGMAEVTIVNLLGIPVGHIFSGDLDAGEHEFPWDASGIPPGMYECIVRTNGKTDPIPIIFVR